jgi:hypothetical protein
MSQSLRQDGDGSMGIVGTDGGYGAFVPVTFNYNVPAVNQAIFTADRAMAVKGLRGRVDVVGTGGACTYQIRKAVSGTIGTSGVLLHSGTFNLVGTINTQQTLTLTTTAADALLAAGDSIYMHLTGTATSAIGQVTIHLCPL